MSDVRIGSWNEVQIRIRRVQFFVNDSSNCEFITFLCCEYLILDPFLYVEQDYECASPLLMNSGSFVLNCQPIRRITAGYECIIIMSLQGRAKWSPSVFWRLPNCCPITPRHLLDRNSVCSAESIQGDTFDNPLKKFFATTYHVSKWHILWQK